MSQFIHSAEVVTLPIRDSTLCCTTGCTSHPHNFGVGPSRMIKANHCPFPRPRMPTHYCPSSTKDRHLPIIRLYLRLTRTAHHRHPAMGRWGIPPIMLTAPQGLCNARQGHPLTYEREKVQLTSPPHNRSYGWLVLYGTRITEGICN